MQISNDYILREINNTYYILPIGQRIADHKRGVLINEIGVSIWNILQTKHSQSELIEELCNEYSCDCDTRQAIEDDIRRFISQLCDLGIITKEISIPNPSRYFNIAGINISYCGKDTLVHKSLKDFESVLDNNSTVKISEKIDQNWIVLEENTAPIYEGRLLIHSEHVHIYVSENKYIFYFPENKFAKKCSISFDNKEVLIYCTSYGNDLQRTEEVFQIMRLAFLKAAQTKGLFAIHSASILYNNKAWLFSAPSGIGKSTHTNMWKELYNTPIINGDLNLIGIENGQPAVYGIPWCGTSGKYSTHKQILDGIVLLSRADKDIINTLTPHEKVVFISQRLISPTWNEELFDINLDFCKELINLIKVCRFSCTKNTSAIETIKQYIDKDTSDHEK